MNEKILEQLDYYRIRETIAGCCMSEEGRNALLNYAPLIDENIIDQIKAESAEWMGYLSSSFPQAMAGWPPVKALFPVINVEGAILELEEVYALGLFCQASAQIVERIHGAVNSGLLLPKLAAKIESIPSLKAAETEIFRIIDVSGQLRDLPELRAIRSEILHIRRDIDALVRRYTSDSQLKDILQSSVPVLRSDRQVLAVRANFKGRIKGIVHEVSQSGQTVYIEPEDVVSRGNDLIQSESRLKQEIRNILKKLTERLGVYRDDFESAFEIMIHLDMRYAAARWGLENHCVFAFPCHVEQQNKQESLNCGENGEITGNVKSGGSCESDEELPLLLLKARHPLLGNRAVPIDIRFLTGKRILIVTGPNTGGKTVALKTVALFALLNQSGFPLPAAEGTRLPIFTGIFADIGDDQSLDQSLSTFSGHMKNIAEALAGADNKSLVLLDELGSGTDPQEGGAIGMAVLDYLIEKKAFVLVTTHHGILKNYGYTNPICVNASVEFDAATLAPSYKILMGVPGESHALDIAKRNGLLPAVVEKAASYLSNEQADVSALIKGLTEKHTELDKMQKEFREKETFINEKRRNVDLRDLRLRQKELELRKTGCRESKKFLEESRRKLENLVRELREGEITREKTLKVKDMIADFTKAVEDEQVSIHAQQDGIDLFTTQVAKNEFLALSGDNLTDNSAEKNNLKIEGKKKRRNRQLLADAGIDLSHNEEISNALIYSKNAVGNNKKLQNGQGFSVNMEVLIGTKNQHGVILSPAKKKSWLVQVGSLRMAIKESDMRPAPVQQKKPAPSISIELSSGIAGFSSDGNVGYNVAGNGFSTENDRVSFAPVESDKAVFELRLLGMHYDDAMKALQRQLDLAALQGLHSFSIIHGKGYGVLQQAVQESLKNYPGVSEFHYARPEDGGTGKTYVTLD